MSSLYHLTAELQQLLDLESYSDEELQKLDSVYEDFQDKCVAVATVIKEMEARQSAIDEAQAAMMKRSNALEDKIESLKCYLKESMIKSNVNKIDKSPYFDIVVRANPERVDTTGEPIPAEYFAKKETYSLDKKLVKDAINRGIEITGVKLVRDTSILIK